MRILHTSDWHIGCTLYGNKRIAEFKSFLYWLSDLIEDQEIDVLLVAGDIFHTTTPGNKAQKLYYQFLNRVAAGCCRHVVIIGGNHDSPSFLNAPKELLFFLNVHVIGSAMTDLADEVLVLKDNHGKEELIVSAVPYLRDRDVRSVEPGETVQDKNTKLIHGISDHYQQVCQIAQEINKKLEKPVPLVALGHLFTAGGKVIEGDGVRDLYIGSLARISADIFPGFLDYVALGHLHVPQKVAGSDIIRYSGSPLPIGFGEASQEKTVIRVEFFDTKTKVQPITIPKFNDLKSIKGNLEKIKEEIATLKQKSSKSWVEVIYTGKDAPGNLRDTVDQAVKGTEIKVLRIKNERISTMITLKNADGGVLSAADIDEMDEFETFTKCMNANAIPDKQQSELMEIFKQIVRDMGEES